MKKIDEEKINAVGQTLGVELSETKQRRRQKIGKIIVGIIQGLVILGSILLGINYGYEGPGYPFSLSSSWSFFGEGFFFETLIHTGNGIFLMPKEMRFGLSRLQRTKIFLGNLIISFALFMISFGITWNQKYRPGTLYSVYDNQPTLSESKNHW